MRMTHRRLSRGRRRAGWVLGGVAVLAAGLVGVREYRPGLGPLEGRRLESVPAEAGGLAVTFLGVSTLLFQDGETALLTDGFFSRPGLARTLFTRLEPEPSRVVQALRRAGIRHLAAVLVGHSHYDHVLDAPLVTHLTDSVLVGSRSTVLVGEGYGLLPDNLLVPQEGQPLRFGRFTVTFLRSRHAPTGAPLEGEIPAPLSPPARASAFREGGTFSLLIEHEGRRMLVQGSAGFVEGALVGRQADVVFLGAGGLGTQRPAYREAYWHEVVQTVGARRVIPIHWDDFWRPLDAPLVPMPRVLDDFATSATFLLEHGQADGVDVRLAPVGERVDPFAGL
jgi:L-ascorbate metabolism protein UlaG (beta-lactamase superfamily)